MLTGLTAQDSLKDQNDESLSPNQREEGRIFIDLHALGPMDDLYSLIGYGSLKIKDKDQDTDER